MRLLCDEMLGALARWLRAAGHDADLARGGEPDAALLARCRSEARILLTRDRELARTSAGEVRALLLEHDDPDVQASRLSDVLGLDWLAAPFTRCMVDNTPLDPAGKQELARMPETSRRLPGPFRTCPRCGRVFWPGSHVRRMQRQLEAWARGRVDN